MFGLICAEFTQSICQILNALFGILWLHPDPPILLNMHSRPTCAQTNHRQARRHCSDNKKTSPVLQLRGQKDVAILHPLMKSNTADPGVDSDPLIELFRSSSLEHNPSVNRGANRLFVC